MRFVATLFVCLLVAAVKTTGLVTRISPRTKKNASSVVAWRQGISHTGTAMYSSLPASTSSASSQMGLVSVVLGSLLTATLAYSLINHEWSLPWCFYYATQAVFGVMYGNLQQSSPLGDGFTLLLYIGGSSLCASAVGAFLSSALQDAALVASDERRKHRASFVGSRSSLSAPESAPVSDEGLSATMQSMSVFHSGSRKFFTFAIVAWVALGTVATALFKGVEFPRALQIALGAVSAAGSPSPSADVSSFSDTESLALALYISVGVPLFAAALGQLSVSVIEQAVRQDEQRTLARPLTDEEFKLVKGLHSHSGHLSADELSSQAADCDEADEIDLSDFIVLEMLRLQRLDEEELRAITALFDDLHENGGDSLRARRGEASRTGRKRLPTSHAKNHLYRR